MSAPGFNLEPVSFTPESSPAAPNPKFVGQQCRGMRVRVTDPKAAEPYRLGIELVAALRSEPEFEWRRDGEALTWLVGTRRLLDNLHSGKTVEEIIEADTADHEAWRRERESALLY